MCTAVYNSNATLMSCKTDAPAPAGEVVPECNCNGWRPRQSPIVDGSAKQAEAFLQQHKWADVLFEEIAMADDPYVGPAAVQVAVVRHPFARFLSHLMHERVAFGYDAGEATATREHVSMAMQNLTALLSAPTSIRETYAFTILSNNYMTRFFAGVSWCAAVRAALARSSIWTPARASLARCRDTTEKCRAPVCPQRGVQQDREPWAAAAPHH